MKTFCLSVLIFTISISSFGQVLLSQSETNLLKDIYAQNKLSLKEGTLLTLRKTAPERFQGFIEQVIVTKDKPKNVLNLKYYKRPSHEELVFWYVLRELFYNNSEAFQKPEDEVIQWVLQDTIDERWLLDNYYYRLQDRLGLLFNKANLSKFDFPLNELGFKDNTEKAICFFSVTNACGLRLAVMALTGKGDPGDVISRFPTFNGKPYYYYIDFDYPDFNWIGYKETESFNSRHLQTYYTLLLNHLGFLLKEGQTEEANNVFTNSILSKPEYFKFSGDEEAMNDIYKALSGN